MGVDQSVPMRRSPMDSLFERALIDALQEMSHGSSRVTAEQLEHAWDPQDCSPKFRILPDRLTARRLPSFGTTDAIRGKKGYRQGRHVWEIAWDQDERGEHAVIGVATPQAHLQCLGYVPLLGCDAESWGWDLSKKMKRHKEKDSPYPTKPTGILIPDTVYVILDMDQATLSFATKNTHLGVAFRNLTRHLLKPLCPCASAVYGDCNIRMKYLGRGESFLAGLKEAEGKASLPGAPQRPTLMPRTQSPSCACPQSPMARCPPQSPNATTPGQFRTIESDPVRASENYKFHHTCGENIAVMIAGKKARRIDALQTYDQGIVITKNPLQDDELFEVRLDSKVPKWYGGLDIGATNVPAEDLEFPGTMTDCRQGTTFVLSSNKILNNGKEMVTLSGDVDLDNLSVGDRVGVMRKSEDNSLHFFVNGVDIGKKIKSIPSVLYGVVDVFGQAEEVTITGGAAGTETSNQEQNAIVSVLIRMTNTINILKEGTFSDIGPVIAKLAKDVLQSYMETTDRSLRQKFGDHLSEIGAPAQLTKFLRRLMDTGMETEEGWAGMYVVRSTFWNYSDASLKMACTIGRSGALKLLLNDLDKYGAAKSTNEKKSFLVSSAINILHNCAKASENRQIFIELRVMDRIAPFAQAEDMEVAVAAILTLSYITPEEKKDILAADSKVISYLLGLLKNSLAQSDFRGKSEVTSCSWSALEIAVGIGNLAVNDTNRETMIDREAIALLVTLVVKGGNSEKECAANALWVLVKDARGRAKFKETPKAMEELLPFSNKGNQSVQEAVKRVLIALKEPVVTQDNSSANSINGRRGPRVGCEYQKACERFKTSLAISGAFFDPKYNVCYCTDCHADRGDKLYYTRGSPAKEYGIPIGWCRFGLKVHHRATALGVFNKWHVAFHGTRVESVKPILECGDLLIPGDVALGGRTLSEEEGHFNDDRKPQGFDTKQIFVSPSVRYAGHNCYAKITRFEDPSSKITYNAKAVLQLCIGPDSYRVGPQTIGATSEIDPEFSNQEIEWSTKQRGSIILYGLLVKLDQT